MFIAGSLPDAAVGIDRPDREGGEWWLDVKSGQFETSVSWTERRGFGIYLGEPGYGERPDEFYFDASIAARRLAHIVSCTLRGIVPAPMGLGQVRKLLGRNQEELARRMHISQANVSRLESRANPTFASYRALAEALGGILEFRVRFPECDVPVALPVAEPEA